MSTNNTEDRDATPASKEDPKNKLIDTSNYLASYTQNSLLIELMGAIAIYSNKVDYPWHVELQLETKFNFSNHEIIRRELDLHDHVAGQVSSFLKQNYKMAKVVSYLKNGYFHYHWYVSSNIWECPKFIAWFAKEKLASGRDLKLTSSADRNWEYIIKNLVKNNKVMVSWTRYIR